jgi:hypothetical protein
MAPSPFQSVVLRLLAQQRRDRGESYNDLEFDGEPPDAGGLGQTWHEALHEAEAICARLPPERIGTCVLAENRELLREAAARLPDMLRAGRVTFHEGRIGGSWPTVLSTAVGE